MKHPDVKPHQHAHFYDTYKALLRKRYGMQSIFFAAMLIGALGWSLWYVYSSGTTEQQTIAVHVDTTAPPQVTDADARCVSLGGAIVSAGRCQLADGRTCDLSEYLSEGVCRDMYGGSVLGLAQEEVLVEASPFVTPTPAIRTQYYRLELEPRNLDALDPRMFLADFLYASLEFERQGIPIQAMRQILYDTRTADPFADVSGYGRYAGTYYLVLEWMQALDTLDYAYPHISIQVTPLSTPTFPEIDDRRYCDTDAACEVRTNICTYGAYNHFQAYLDQWSCPSIVAQDGGLRRYYDQDLQCEVEVSYVQPRCIDNRCVAGSRIVQCL